MYYIIGLGGGLGGAAAGKRTPLQLPSYSKELLQQTLAVNKAPSNRWLWLLFVFKL